MKLKVKTGKAKATKLSDAAKTARVLFNQMPGDALLNLMCEAPTRLATDRLEALLDICKELGMDVEHAQKVALDKKLKKVHCVRCHDEFFEGDNNSTACVITHDDLESDFVEGALEYKWECSACGESDYGDCPDDMLEVYFQGHHMTKNSEVQYRGSILTCEDNGCF